MNLKVRNCMVDWVEFSVFGLSYLSVLYILEIDKFCFQRRNGFYYSDVYSYENCIVVSDGFKGNSKEQKEECKHVHVKITGKGCRLLEQMYRVTDLRKELAMRFMFLKLKVSRLDICIDFKFKFVTRFMDAVKNKEFKGFRSAPIVGEKEKGFTFYLGSRKSDKYWRAYEKDFHSGDFENYSDRLELVLKDFYATNEFFNDNDLYKIASTYMNDIKWNDEFLESEWKSMQGEKCEVSPKIRHRKSTLREKTDYILKTYGKTLRAYAEEYGTKEITKAIYESVLSAADIRMLNNEKVIKLHKHRRDIRQKMDKASDVADYIAYKNGHLHIEQLRIVGT